MTGALPARRPGLANADQGLFRKFDVARTDGSSEPGGKHDGCEYFVLDMTHDPHAVAAVLAYADACAPTHPFLAVDLRTRYGERAALVAAGNVRSQRILASGNATDIDRVHFAAKPERVKVAGVVFARTRRGAPLIVRAHGDDGVFRDVGRIQRGRGKSDWGLYLDGIYWRTVRVGKGTTQEPTTRGGASGVRCRTQRDAMDGARATLTNLGMRPPT